MKKRKKVRRGAILHDLDPRKQQKISYESRPSSVSSDKHDDIEALKTDFSEKINEFRMSMESKQEIRLNALEEKCKQLQILQNELKHEKKQNSILLIENEELIDMDQALRKKSERQSKQIEKPTFLGAAAQILPIQFNALKKRLDALKRQKNRDQSEFSLQRKQMLSKNRELKDQIERMKAVHRKHVDQFKEYHTQIDSIKHKLNGSRKRNKCKNDQLKALQAKISQIKSLKDRLECEHARNDRLLDEIQKMRTEKEKQSEEMQKMELSMKRLQLQQQTKYVNPFRINTQNSQK